MSENSGKIKSIIVSKIEDSLKEENNEFLDKIKIPIYLVSLNFYTELRKFFIEGIGGTYLTTNKKIARSDSDIIPIYYPSLLLKNKSENDEDKIGNTKNNKYTNFYMEGDFCLQRLFSDDDKEQIDKDKKIRAQEDKISNLQKKVDYMEVILNSLISRKVIKHCINQIINKYKSSIKMIKKTKTEANGEINEFFISK